MYRNCVTEISVQHQKQVEEALLELMQKLPYEDITVTQLCQTANLSRRVFYHLFNSKAGALHALLDHTILNMESWHPEIRDDALRDNQMTGLLLERMLESVMNESYDLRSWLKRNGWSREKDIIIFHLSGIMGLVFRWYYSGFQESPEEMATLIRKIMTVPLAQNPAKK